MDWLANLISSLPIDEISDAVSRITIWWTHFVADVPPDELPMNAYVGFSVIVLILWLFIVRVLPKPLGGISWIAVFAVLLTPGVAVDSSEIAPANIGVIYGVLMEDPGLALRSLLPILVVFSVGLFLGFIWQLIRSTMESSAEKAHRQAIADERASVQLASANYVDLIEGDSSNAKQPMLAKKKKTFKKKGTAKK